MITIKNMAYCSQCPRGKNILCHAVQGLGRNNKVGLEHKREKKKKGGGGSWEP